jgi:small subunit ribosomal protein S3
MGQKVNPLGFRIGISERWRSRWYANKQEFPARLIEDQKIRQFVRDNFFFAGIAKVEIERPGEGVIITMHCARPGVIIGRKGAKVDEARSALETLTSRSVDLRITEVPRPELEAILVAEGIAEQLKKRAAFRRTMKKAITTSMAAGAQGIKIRLSGRLGGAEMSRQEKMSEGKVPLHTLRANISYGLAEAKTTYGVIGVKVWIYQGDYAQEGMEHDADAKKGKVPKAPARQDQGQGYARQ